MGEVSLRCGDKKQPQKPAFLLKDDWKAVLQYSPSVSISKQAASGCQDAINHICCKFPVRFRKAAGDFICKSQNFSFQTVSN